MNVTLKEVKPGVDVLTWGKTWDAQWQSPDLMRDIMATAGNAVSADATARASILAGIKSGFGTTAQAAAGAAMSVKVYQSNKMVSGAMARRSMSAGAMATDEHRSTASSAASVQSEAQPGQVLRGTGAVTRSMTAAIAATDAFDEIARASQVVHIAAIAADSEAILSTPVGLAESSAFGDAWAAVASVPAKYTQDATALDKDASRGSAQASTTAIAQPGHILQGTASVAARTEAEAFIADTVESTSTNKTAIAAAAMADIIDDGSTARGSNIKGPIEAGATFRSTASVPASMASDASAELAASAMATARSSIAATVRQKIRLAENTMATAVVSENVTPEDVQAATASVAASTLSRASAYDIPDGTAHVRASGGSGILAGNDVRSVANAPASVLSPVTAADILERSLIVDTYLRARDIELLPVFTASGVALTDAMAAHIINLRSGQDFTSE